MTIETELAALVASTTALTTAVNVTKVSLDTDVATTTTAATASAVSAASATAIGTVATTQAANALTSANGAVVSRDLAIQAWGASTVAYESLSATSQTLHYGSVMASVIYDTSKDSDGGAWRDRCADKSWYQEQTCNKWLGRQPDDIAALTFDGTFGSNIVVNGDGSSLTGWTQGNTGASVWNSTGGVFVATTNGTDNARLRQAVPTIAGKLYAVDIGTATAGSYTVGTTSGGAEILTYGSGLRYFTALGATSHFNFVTPINGTQVDNVSVKEVTTRRGGLINLFFNSDVSSGIGVKYNGIYGGVGTTGVLTANYGIAPDGTMTAARAQLTLNGGTTISDRSGITANDAPIDNAVHTMAIYLKSLSGTPTVLTRIHGSLVYTTLNTSTWTLVLVTGNSSTDTTTSLVEIRGAQPTTTSNTADVLVWGAGLFQGTYTAQSISDQGGVPSTTTAIGANSLCDYYQSTANGKFYALDLYGNSIEIFRGNSKKFPAVAGIVVELGRVVIYDLTQPGCPMWMAFVGAGDAWINTMSGAVTAAAAINGQIYVSLYGKGCSLINFISDGGYIGGGGVMRRLSSNLVTVRKQGASAWSLCSGVSLPKIITPAFVNGVTVDILPDAPIDAATGLPTPTVYLSSDVGLWVIKNNGTVVFVYSTNKCFGTSVKDGVLSLLSEDGSNSGSIGNPIVLLYNQKTLAALPQNFLTNSSIPSFQATGWNSKCVIAESSVGHSSGSPNYNKLWKIKFNPANIVKSLTACITDTYNSGWQVGDSRGAWLADTVAESISAPELVTNGTFTVDTSGWTSGSGAILSSVGGKLRITSSGTIDPRAFMSLPTIVGKSYNLSASVTSGTHIHRASIFVSTMSANVYAASASSANLTASFIATSTSTIIYCMLNDSGSSTAGVYADFDNVSMKIMEPDRSAKNSGLDVVGTIVKTAVTTGSSLMSYPGMGAVNHLEQPYSANLDFGTGDFCYMWWESPISSTAQQRRFERRVIGATASFSFYTPGSFNYTIIMPGGISRDTLTAQLPGFNFIVVMRSAGVLYFYLNGRLMYSIASTESMTEVGAVLRIGTDCSATPAWSSPPLSLFRISATAPTADQIAFIYATELPLFQPNAKCTIDGTSTAVTALSADGATNSLCVGTSWGRSTFRDLLRVESEATTVGNITSIACSGGTMITSGTSANVMIPMIPIRDELKTSIKTNKATTKSLVTVEYDAVTSQTTFVLPSGLATTSVSVNGALKRNGATKDYTTSFDGFQESVVFGIAPGNTAFVEITATRNN